MSAVLSPVEDDFPHDRQVAQLRVPPHSIESESAVLGGLLLDNGAWDRVGDLLTEGDFYRHEHRLIFGTIGALMNATRPADPFTVLAQLEAVGKAGEAGGLAYLASLAQYVPSAGNIHRYAMIVRERSILRRLISAADEIASGAFNPQGKPVDAIVDVAMQKILSVSTDAREDEWVPMGTLVVRQLDRIQKLADDPEAGRGSDYIPTGMDNVDELFDGGLRAGQYIVIAARPSMGKTAMAYSIGQHVALNEGLPVAVFSMEMENDEGAQRALANAGSVPLHALRRPAKMADADWSALINGVERIRSIPFYSNESPGLNINQVRAKARALYRRLGRLGLIIVDYFQLMSGVDPRANRSTQLEEASRGLKSLAKELKCPVIALAQVNRSVEKVGEAWEKQMPRMSDLKDCGSLEQDADVIWFLLRPTVAQEGLADEWKPYARGQIAKQRGGRTGPLNFLYEGKYTRYTAWPSGSTVPSSKVLSKGKEL